MKEETVKYQTFVCRGCEHNPCGYACQWKVPEYGINRFDSAVSFYTFGWQNRATCLLNLYIGRLNLEVEEEE